MPSAKRRSTPTPIRQPRRHRDADIGGLDQRPEMGTEWVPDSAPTAAANPTKVCEKPNNGGNSTRGTPIGIRVSRSIGSVNGSAGRGWPSARSLWPRVLAWLKTPVICGMCATKSVSLVTNRLATTRRKQGEAICVGTVDRKGSECNQLAALASGGASAEVAPARLSAMTSRAARGLAVCGLAATIAIALPTGAHAASLTLLSPQKPERTITMEPEATGGLVGRLQLAVSNRTRSAGPIVARYFPAGDLHGTATGQVSLRRPDVRVSAGGLVSVELIASLPKGSSPADLNGIVELSLKTRPQTGVGALDLEITGASPTFAAITIFPATLTLHTVGWLGPFSTPGRVSTRVQVTGPASQSCSPDAGRSLGRCSSDRATDTTCVAV